MTVVDMICPRRSYGSLTPPPDKWHDDETCSYCGSMSPDEFFRLVDAGAEVTPTDKNYKAYITFQEPNPDELVIKSGSNAEEKPKDNWGEWRATADLPENLKTSSWSDYRWVCLAKRGPTKMTKVYFQHFKEDHMIKFVAYLNAKKMKIAHPGHFYVRPFFVKIV